MQESIQLVIDSAPFLLKGAVFTLQLSIGGMFFGLVLGFILALMRMSPVWPVKWLARMYISIFRGTPLIAQLFMIYYGLPQFGIELDPIPAAMIGLSLNTAAYAAETLRAAIASMRRCISGSSCPFCGIAPCSGTSANPENSPIYFFSPLAKSEAKGSSSCGASASLAAGASGSAVRPSDLSISASTSISLSRLMKRNSLSASSCL